MLPLGEIKNVVVARTSRQQRRAFAGRCVMPQDVLLIVQHIASPLRQPSLAVRLRACGRLRHCIRGCAVEQRIRRAEVAPPRVNRGIGFGVVPVILLVAEAFVARTARGDQDEDEQADTERDGRHEERGMIGGAAVQALGMVDRTRMARNGMSNTNVRLDLMSLQNKSQAFTYISK